ncbi:uncharacterized [Lates japonicus]
MVGAGCNFAAVVPPLNTTSPSKASEGSRGSAAEEKHLSCRGDGAVCRRQSRVWSKLAGTEEEAAVWTGWTAFSSRAFQNLPGASLKQKEGEEETFSIMQLCCNGLCCLLWASYCNTNLLSESSSNHVINDLYR